MNLQRYLLMLIENKRVRHIIIYTLIAIFLLFFLLVYSIISLPWAMINGVYKAAIGDTPEQIEMWGGNIYDAITGKNPLFEQEKYKEEHEKMKKTYGDIIKPVFEKKLQETITGSEIAADEFAEDFKANTDCPSSIDGVPATHEWNITTSGTAFPQQFNENDKNAISVIACMFNNIGYEVQIDYNTGLKDYSTSWYENHPEVFEYLQSERNEVTNELLPSFSQVDTKKMQNFIEANKDDFYISHIPSEACKGGVPPVIYSPDDCKIYYTYSESQTAIEEDQGHWDYEYGINPDTNETEVVDKEWVENWVVVEIHVTHNLDATGVGFVEYRGFDLVEDLLYIDKESPLMQKDPGELTKEEQIEVNRILDAHARIDELYQIHLEIIGEHSSVTDSKGTASSLIDYNENHDTLAFNTGWSKPIRNNGLRISAWFLDSTYPAQFGKHWGIDITGARVYGNNVYPVKTAEVAKIRHSSGGFGNNIVLYLGKGPSGEKYYAIYAHLSYINTSLKVGDIVMTNTKIGQVGSTGNSTGPHLHFELQVVNPDGTHSSIDPVNYGFSPNWYSQ